MGVIRHKIWKDLWANKSRTFQVVLIISVGAFALGMIITTRNLTISGMEQIWLEASPPMIGMWTSDMVDDESIRSLENIDGIVATEGFGTDSIEWKLNEEDDWLAGNATFRSDYEDQQFSIVSLNRGSWPIDEDIAAGQGTDTVFGIRIGEEVIIRAHGRENVFKVTGMLDDPIALPPNFGGNAQFFLSRDAFDTVFDTRDNNRIFATAAEFDGRALTEMANKIRDKLEKQDIDTGGFMPPQGDRVVDPSKHFFQDTMDGIFLLLSIMAILALFLGTFLVYNTINAIISQQVDQIGVMKAIGASSWQILLVYLTYVLALGFMALLIALPLGILGGWYLNAFLLNSFNADPGPFTYTPTAIWVMAIISVGAPLAVALIPILSGSRITVREAINTYGLNTNTSFLDRQIARLKRISRILLLTISNTFRKKGRVFLTQISLVLSGLIFMMVISVGDSVNYTFNELLFSILNSNINLIFPDGERISWLEGITENFPGVEKAEMWAYAGGTGRPIDQEASDDDPGVSIFGVPPDTELYGYQMRTGRWLTADDTYSVVLNQDRAAELGVKVGDRVTFDLGVTGESDWLVVGTYFDPLIPTSAHVARSLLLREQNSAGRTNSIWIKTTQGGAAFEEQVVKGLRDFYEAHGIDVAPGGLLNNQDTSSEIVANINTQFRSIIVLLTTMAVLIGIVGSISLSGTLSLGVIERQREIGVMRAIGASSWDVARLFVGEGLILGWLSWLIAFPLSLPAGRLMTDALGAALGGQLVYYYTIQGALIWLGIITVLSVLASWLPARRAIRISVRESLSYQ